MLFFDLLVPGVLADVCSEGYMLGTICSIPSALGARHLFVGALIYSGSTASALTASNFVFKACNGALGNKSVGSFAFVIVTHRDGPRSNK